MFSHLFFFYISSNVFIPDAFNFMKWNKNSLFQCRWLLFVIRFLFTYVLLYHNLCCCSLLLIQRACSTTQFFNLRRFIFSNGFFFLLSLAFILSISITRALYPSDQKTKKKKKITSENNGISYNSSGEAAAAKKNHFELELDSKQVERTHNTTYNEKRIKLKPVKRAWNANNKKKKEKLKAFYSTTSFFCYVMNQNCSLCYVNVLILSFFFFSFLYRNSSCSKVLWSDFSLSFCWYNNLLVGVSFDNIFTCRSIFCCCYYHRQSPQVEGTRQQQQSKTWWELNPDFHMMKIRLDFFVICVLFCLI